MSAEMDYNALIVSLLAAGCTVDMPERNDAAIVTGAGNAKIIAYLSRAVDVNEFFEALKNGEEIITAILMK